MKNLWKLNERCLAFGTPELQTAACTILQANIKKLDAANVGSYITSSSTWMTSALGRQMIQFRTPKDRNVAYKILKAFRF